MGFLLLSDMYNNHNYYNQERIGSTMHLCPHLIHSLLVPVCRGVEEETAAVMRRYNVVNQRTPCLGLLVRVVVDGGTSPVNGRVAGRLARGLDDGGSVKDRLVVLGIQLHEERLPLLNQLSCVSLNPTS